MQQHYQNILIKTILFLCFYTFAFSQIMIKAKPGETFFIQELNTIVLLKENKIIVEAVLPIDTREKEYQDIDIADKDEIIMINGKRIKTVQEMIDIYNELKTEEEMKLGIKRDGNLMIVSFKKADMESMPKGKMKTIRVENDGGVIKETIIDSSGVKKEFKNSKVIIKKEGTKSTDIK